jgi:hypothetical protein
MFFEIKVFKQMMQERKSQLRIHEGKMTNILGQLWLNWMAQEPPLKFHFVTFYTNM